MADPKSQSSAANDNRLAWATADRPIAMRRISFTLPPFDIPGKDAAGGIEARVTTEGRGYTIEFLPWLRSYLVTYHSHDTKQRPHPVLIPESRVQRADPAL